MAGFVGVEVVVVDHHDSYTQNLVHLIGGLVGRFPTVLQHDEVSVDELAGYSHIILSAGPGHPSNPADFAVGEQVLRAARIPVFGVCLGMQGIVTAYGGRVARHAPAHGEVSEVIHDRQGVFTRIPSPLKAVRYHSLVAVEWPACLEVSARSSDGTVMAVRHRSLPQEGVQFHPESVLSEHGVRLMENFLTMS